MMKRTFACLAMVLALGACGEDKPKKKKAETPPAEVATPVAQTAPEPVAPQAAPLQTVEESQPQQPAYTPSTELPTDAQSGYKAYIEPVQHTESVQMADAAPVATHTEVVEYSGQNAEVQQPAEQSPQTETHTNHAESAPSNQPSMGLDSSRPVDAFSNPTLEMMQN